MKRLNKHLTIFVVFCLIGGYILITAARTMYTQADYWTAVKDRFTADSLSVPALRGNILASDGKVMVASLPEYRLRMDYVVVDKNETARIKAQHWRDSVYREKLDSIAEGLAQIFPDKDAHFFRSRLEAGRRNKARSWAVYPGYATYIQYMACKQLPLFRESSIKGGFYAETKMLRKKLYGSLASRTLGDVYRDSDAAKSGLEWCYDTLLRGRPGISHRTKVRSKWLDFIDLQPINGHDLQTTIDVRMQDIAEKALLNKLKEKDVQGEKGVVILMEVATGDIKAMVSMSRVRNPETDESRYYEIQNDAINALWEPGSTFKTASIMAGLEHGYFTPETIVKTGSGIYNMHGRPMKDHNWRKGGYGDLNVTEILGYSSNIGVSWLIDQYYHDQPEKYVQALYDMGVGIPLGMVMGADPRVRMPRKEGRQWANWSKTALAWMSIGYETQMAPISTLAFYNAIANGGKMVRPRFVKAQLENGRTVREFPVEVIKERICSPRTLQQIQMILEQVVSKGLGKSAGNRSFPVSGKTGTAQVALNGNYRTHRYMVSFCGYFPSDAPKYSCIVCILKDGLPASGGGQCGPVFSEISQQVMNQGKGQPAEEARDSTSVFTPTLAAGNLDESRRLLRMMNIPWREAPGARSTWGEARVDSASQRLLLTRREKQPNTDRVPDVRGMGARDAVYTLQQAGLRVRTRGTGRVDEQSIPAGTRNAAGRTITINMK